jgi:glutathione synthase/RimK-type ligase-like ATP-grasp enzyme
VPRPIVVLASCRYVLDSAGSDPFGQADYEAGDGLLAQALTDRGFVAELAAWDDPDVDWSRVAGCVLRSTWDYPERLDEFIRWAASASQQTILINELPLVRWNLHKRYLLDLEAAGIPVVPTVLIQKGSAIDVPHVCDKLQSQHLVAKPAVGVGAFGVTRLAATDPVSADTLSNLIETSDVILQPYIESIEMAGELSTVMIAGAISHAVLKVPAPGDYRVQAHHGGRNVEAEIDAALEAVAQSLIEVLPATPVYGRIDTVWMDARPRLLELELIEPSLFLGYKHEAAARLADAITRRIQPRPS